MSSVDSSLLSGASYLTHNVCGEMLQLFDDGEKIVSLGKYRFYFKTTLNGELLRFEYQENLPFQHVFYFRAANPTKCGKFLSWFNSYVVVFRLSVLILGALSLGLCLGTNFNAL